MSNAVTQRWLVHRAKRWLEPTDRRARRYLIIIPRRRVVVRALFDETINLSRSAVPALYRSLVMFEMIEDRLIVRFVQRLTSVFVEPSILRKWPSKPLLFSARLLVIYGQVWRAFRARKLKDLFSTHIRPVTRTLSRREEKMISFRRSKRRL